MKLYIEILKLLGRKFILRENNGIVIKNFVAKMGVVYIKLAQILATQNYGNLFTEKDRKMLKSICDECNPLPFKKIKKILKQEYGELENLFKYIEPEPTGSASVSQVHRALLKSGEEVAIKIKRQDITKTMEQDIKQIRKIVHRFGKFVKFRNLMGSDHALDLYLEWIKTETDFNQEKENIKTYQNFANTVNGKVKGTTRIKIPKLYEEYCTENIIVMEFIKEKTINHIDLTKENKSRIVKAMNSYIKSSFWAMFNNEPVIFHGDPHSGNICIDDENNLYFLDMGLLFALSESEVHLCLEFFLTAYSGNAERLYKLLIRYGKMNEKTKKRFKKDCKRYCEEIKTKELTFYFIDMMTICLNYQLDPPEFLFRMAKAFLCINGISIFSNNNLSAFELLGEQVIEFLLKRSLNDCTEIIKDSLKLIPDTFENTLNYGVVNTLSKISCNQTLRQDVKNSLKNLKEILMLFKTSIEEEEPEEPFTQNRKKHLNQ